MNLFIFIVEVPLILSKDNANRRQYKICKDKNCKFETCFIVEVPLILCRDDKERRNRQTLWGGCTDANPKLLLNDT